MTAGVTHKLQVDLRYEVKALTEKFWQLSTKMVQAAKEMHEPGVPPPEALLAEITAIREEFAALRAQLLGLARIVDATPLPDPEAVVSLRDLAGLLQTAQETRKKSKMDEAKHQVLQKLDRVQNLAHKEKADFGPLIDCQHHAAQLKLAIAPADWANPSPDLVEGLLPFMDLLRMVEQLDELDDETCEQLQDSVAKSFGKLLAVAVARGRVILPESAREPAPEPAPALAAEAPAPPAASLPETTTVPAVEAKAPAVVAASGEAAPDQASAAAPEAPPEIPPAAPAGPALAPAEAALADVPQPEVQELTKLATELYVLLGHEVQKTILRSDHNVDLMIRASNGKKWLARCRSQTAPVQEGEVRSFYGVMQHEKAAQGAIITLGSFTPQARQWAKRDLLYLLDKQEFHEYLRRARSRK